MSEKQTVEAGNSLPPPLGSGRIFKASITEIEGDVWLHVTAPNGNKGSLNLNQLTCGPITRKAFVEWARSHIQNDQAQAAPLAASSLERLVGQED